MDLERITRRAAVTRGFGGVALVCSFKFDERAPTRGRVTSAKARAAAAGAFEPFQRDVPISPLAKPVQQTRSLQQYVVTMKPGTADILPGYRTPILGYDGLFPGPTIRATRGRAVEVRQINRSRRELNVHLHGGVTPPQFDGHPHDAIPDGTERLYEYPNVQRSATLWYHDLVLGNGRETIQIAGDGGLLPKPVKRPLIPLQPAERADVVIDFRQFGAGSQVITVGADDPGPPVDPGTPWTAPDPVVDTGPPAALSTSLAPTVFETGDVTPPRVSLLSVSGVTRGARVRVRVSEAATLTIRLLLGSKPLATKRVRVQASRTTAATVKLSGRVHLMKTKRLRVQVTAEDAADLVSGSHSARVWVGD